MMQVPPQAWALFMRPPRNPRQNAALVAGVLILVSGLFGLIFGNLILYNDLRTTEWDEWSDEETTYINTSALVSGVSFLAAFAFSLVSTYLCFRQQRFMVALAGPIVLVVAYLTLTMYLPILLFAMAHVLVLSVIAIGLLLFALPIFFHGRGWEPLPGTPSEGAAPPSWPGVGGHR